MTDRKTVLTALHAVKAAIRQPYVWPGGYPLYVVMADGESLSIAAAKSHWRAICRACIFKSANYRDDWEVHGVETNWEDGALYCADTNERIESAYAEPEQVES